MKNNADLQTLFLLFSAAVSLAFILGSLFLLNCGFYLGKRRLAREGTTKLTGLNAVEGGIFGLMGLLLAFSMSGALQRFDERRQLILREANEIGTAYDRLDLVGGELGRKLKTKLKEYLKARMEFYNAPTDFSLFAETASFSDQQQAKLFALKTEMWDEAVAACGPAGSNPACAIVPSLNSVFEVARTRSGGNERHPPPVIFAMLFVLGLGASLLAGFEMAAAKTRSWVHMVTFSTAIGLALFIIIDVEFPRLGLIQVGEFDHFLSDLYQQMR